MPGTHIKSQMLWRTHAHIHNAKTATVRWEAKTGEATGSLRATVAWRGPLWHCGRNNTYLNKLERENQLPKVVL